MTMHEPAKKKRKRVLHHIRIDEISGCDMPAQEHALVTMLKRREPDTPAEHRAALLARCDDVLADFCLLNKFNPNHDKETGQFSESPGGSSSSSSSTDSTSSSTDGGGGEISREHKTTTWRWARNALWAAKAISWGITIVAAVSALVATAPVSGTAAAIGAALATLITRSSLTRAAAFIALDQGLDALIEHRERELNKSADTSDPILRTLLAMKSELARMKAAEQQSTTKYNRNHDRRGRFASGPFTSGAGFPGGGSKSPAPSSAPASPQKRSRLRRALRIAGATARAAADTWILLNHILGPEVMTALTFAAIGAAVGAVKNKPAPAKPAQPAHSGVSFWMDKSMPKLTEMQARRVLAKLPDLLIDEQTDKVIAALERRKDRPMDKNADYFESDEFQSLVDAECGRSAMPRHIGAQRVLAKFGSRPDVSALTKARKASDAFDEVVSGIQGRDHCSRITAMQKARREYPDAYEAFQSS